MDFQWYIDTGYDFGYASVYVRHMETRKPVSIDNNTKHFLVHGEHKDGTLVDPLFKVSFDELQGLMNALWVAGVRPANGEGSVGQIGATKEHMEDMRKIAFKLLKIKDE